MTDAKDPILVAATPDGVLRMASDETAPLALPLPRRPLRKLETPASNKMWLLSFTDITALMLTFFVLTYAMSDPEREDLKNIMAAFNHEVGAFQGEPLQMGNLDTISLPRVKPRKGLDLNYLMDLAASRKAQDPNLTDLIVERQDDAIVFAVPVAALFSGDGLSESGRPVFSSFSALLSGLPNRMELRVDPVQGDAGAQTQALRRMRTLARAWQQAGLADLSKRVALLLGFAEQSGPPVLSVRILAEAPGKAG